MAKIDAKVTNVAIEDDDAELASMWGTPDEADGGEDVEQESWLVDDAGTRIPGPIYLTGNAAVRFTAGMKGSPAGHFYKISDMPENLLKALRALGKEGDAIQVTIRHKGGVEHDYWHIIDPIYYILAHGTPNRAEIARNPKAQLGIASGEFTNEVYDDQKKKTGELQRKTALSVLAVEKHLYQAGYRNEEDGTPGVIALRASGETSGELYEALRANYAVAAKGAEYKKNALMESDPKLTEKQAMLLADRLRGQYWEYGQRIVASDQYKEHKGATGSTEVFPIVSKTPPKRDITPEYIEEMYCGGKLYKELMPLVFTVERTASGKEIRKPGGLAIQYCLDYLAAVQKNIDKFSGPIGPDGKPQRPAWGKRPAPFWWKNKDVIEQHKVINPEYIQGHAAQSEPKDELSYVDEARTEFKKKLRFFELHEDDDEDEAKTIAAQGIQMCKAALEAIKSDFDPENDDLETGLRKRLKAVAGKQRELSLL